MAGLEHTAPLLSCPRGINNHRRPRWSLGARSYTDTRSVRRGSQACCPATGISPGAGTLAAVARLHSHRRNPVGEPQFHRPLLQHESSRPGVEAGPSTNSMVWGVGGSTLQTVAEVLGGGEQSTGCPRLPLQPACRANLSMRGGVIVGSRQLHLFRERLCPFTRWQGLGRTEGCPGSWKAPRPTPGSVPRAPHFPPQRCLLQAALLPENTPRSGDSAGARSGPSVTLGSFGV